MNDTSRSSSKDMAIIILGMTRCALCGEALKGGDDVVATPHVLPTGPLSRYPDAGMHRACFRRWPDAEAFRAVYDAFARSHPRHPRRMQPDGTILDVAEEDPLPRG